MIQMMILSVWGEIVTFCMLYRFAASIFLSMRVLAALGFDLFFLVLLATPEDHDISCRSAEIGNMC